MPKYLFTFTLSKIEESITPSLKSFEKHLCTQKMARIWGELWVLPQQIKKLRSTVCYKIEFKLQRVLNVRKLTIEKLRSSLSDSQNALT